MSSLRIYPRRGALGHGRVNPADGPVKPRDASTLIVWRHGRNDAEVLMGRRLRGATFVPDFFVFPGGRLDSDDYAVRPATPLDRSAVKRMGVRGNFSRAVALAITAVRETFEETGLLLGGSGNIGALTDDKWAYWKNSGLAPRLDRLVYFGRAITSPTSPIRFHARFFIARAEELQGELAGSGELSELRFYPVSDVLAQMPIVDVTEFMLNRIIRYVATPRSFDPKTPVFSYKRELPFVRYE
jgi:8-oxo-dGTP pyrophosphatase MutT (NUDIX family)